MPTSFAGELSVAARSLAAAGFAALADSTSRAPFLTDDPWPSRRLCVRASRPMLVCPLIVEPGDIEILVCWSLKRRGLVLLGEPVDPRRISDDWRSYCRAFVHARLTPSGLATREGDYAMTARAAATLTRPVHVLGTRWPEFEARFGLGAAQLPTSRAA